MTNRVDAGACAGEQSAATADVDTVTAPDVRSREAPADGSHDRFAHFVRKADSVRAYVEGTPLQALCGKVWVPSRDPKRYPVCPTCIEIRKRLIRRADN